MVAYTTHDAPSSSFFPLHQMDRELIMNALGRMNLVVYQKSISSSRVLCERRAHGTSTVPRGGMTFMVSATPPMGRSDFSDYEKKEPPAPTTSPPSKPPCRLDKQFTSVKQGNSYHAHSTFFLLLEATGYGCICN